MKFKILAASAILSYSLGAVAQEEPAYNCTAEETAVYIEQVTYSLFAPSTIPTPDEFTKAHTEAEAEKAKNGDKESSSCATIFSDGELEEDWKELVDKIKNLDIDISFTTPDGAAMKKILDKAKEKVKENLNKALEELGQDVCAMLKTDALKDMLRQKINQKYGVSARNLRMEDYASEITDKAMDDAPDNIQLLLSDDAIYNEVDSYTTEELRKQRKDLWDNF